MRLRTVLSLANLVAIVVAFVVLFEFPQYSALAFYGLVGWMFVGFGLMYLPGVRRPNPALPGAVPGSTSFPNAGGAPLPSTAPGAAAPPIDFCIWCGSTIPPGSGVCPACGRRVVAL